MTTRKRLITGSLAAVGLIAIWFIAAPPRFWLNLTKKVPMTPETGAQLVEKYQCRTCHRIGGEGAIFGPDLAGITKKVNDPAHVTLRLWLRDPSALRPSTPMPNFHLSDSEIEAIILYLAELDGGQ